MNVKVHLALIFVVLALWPGGMAVQSAPLPAAPAVEVVGDLHELLAGPKTPADFPAWQAAMQAWRADRKKELAARHLDLDAVYDLPALRWARRSFVQPQMMAQDRFFYDPLTGRYTVDRYLHDLKARYGGIDSVLIWPTYPNLGIDDRNQYDLTRDLPGGLPGLRRMVADFHHRGVRVLFPLNPWDNGTRDEGVPHAEAMARLLTAVGADGLNGDTMTGVGPEFFQAAARRGHPLALEPENGVGDAANLAWDVLSWGYWWGVQGDVPGVDWDKWVEPRHMTHVCDRWAHDRSGWLQDAFFNGDGFESWENVWGIWNGLTARDAEALRRVALIDRASADLLAGPDYQPHTPTLSPGVYAACFPGRGQTLWTLINRSAGTVAGPQLAVADQPGRRYYDLWHGVPLLPRSVNGTAILDFALEGSGFGAILATDEPLTPPQARLLTQMRTLSATPLAQFGHMWKPLPQRIVPIAPTLPTAQPPPGMALIPAADFTFEVTGTEIEKNEGVDVQYPWEDHPTDAHKHTISIPAFYMDQCPVTNAQFQAFLKASRYRPQDDHNFLRDWKNGRFPDGWATKPVTWVSLEDARAYAAWAGKRLPHEWEWQYAAQGTDGRTYPWGSAWDPARVPTPDRGRALTGPADVDAHPAEASPFGVLDLVGNIWQWTDEFRDAHTRAAVLRGGGYYQPQGSGWYFPEVYTLNRHNKYLLMAPSIDRAGTLGFRCVKDKETSHRPRHEPPAQVVCRL